MAVEAGVAGVEKFRAYIESHMRMQSDHGQRRLPVVTISREAGAGATTVAHFVAREMEKRLKLAEGSWTVLGRELAEKALEHHHLPKRFAEFMPEARVSHVKSMVEELIGLHPSQWTLVQHVVETMLYLADLGNVVLVGRAAHVVTEKLPQAFHVRLVGGTEGKAHRLMRLHGISHEAALHYMREHDAKRREFVKTHFNADVEDVHAYHLVIHTDRIPCERAALLIADEVMRRSVGAARAAD